jgi:hypothetical protein
MMPKDLHIRVPHLLSKENYGTIEALMLGDNLLPSAACSLTAGTVPMPLHEGLGRSLRQQLHQLMFWPNSASETLETRPDGYAFINLSAIPLRHAIESMHEQADLPQPSFGLINLQPERDHTTRGIISSSDVFDNLKHVCIVENSARPGNALLFRASLLLQAHGVEQVSAARAQLYEDVPFEDLTAERHKAFMQHVGKLCL